MHILKNKKSEKAQNLVLLFENTLQSLCFRQTEVVNMTKTEQDRVFSFLIFSKTAVSIDFHLTSHNIHAFYFYLHIFPENMDS